MLSYRTCLMSGYVDTRSASGQVNCEDLLLCHGISVRPSGHFPSVWNNPTGSSFINIIIIIKRLTLL